MKALLTNSSRNCLNDCKRKYYYKYILGYRPVKRSEALYFGSLMHKLLEIWWKENLGMALHWLHQQEINEYNKFHFQKARALINCYDLKWCDSRYDNPVVEKKYRFPLFNVKTKRQSKKFDLGGKCDVIVGKTLIEHKTTVDPIDASSNYWKKLSMDAQISGYYLGAESLDMKCDDCIYDVIKKPKQIPYKKTPDIRYKKDGTPYANQHLEDETPQEYYERVMEVVSNDIDSYFVRKQVPRLDSDLIEYLNDMWGVAMEINYHTNNNNWPRNPAACNNYGTCAFFDVCLGLEDFEHNEKFIKLDHLHPELEDVDERF